MIVESSIRWQDPSSWPWFYYVWAAFALVGTAKPTWRWFQRERAASWPIADGRIASAGFNKPSFSIFVKQGHYVAEVMYSYIASGNLHSGRYSREIPTEIEAEEFIRDLKDQPLVVHYNSEKPSRSTILESDLESLLARRKPAQIDVASQPLSSMPLWITPFLPLLLGLSCIGLALSLWVHLSSVRGQRPAPEPFFWGLHLGIFVVWFPAVLIAQKLVGNVNRRDFWKVLLKNCPPWLRYVVVGFGVYAFINFLLFIETEKTVSAGSSTPANVWRGFSGHWMAFYSAAAAIFYSAISMALRKDSGSQNL